MIFINGGVVSLVSSKRLMLVYLRGVTSHEHYRGCSRRGLATHVVHAQRQLLLDSAPIKQAPAHGVLSHWFLGGALFLGIVC